MSKLEELITELCPDGVEFVTFKKACDFVRGVTYSKEKESKNGIGTKLLRANNITLSTNSLNYNDVKVIDNKVKIQERQWLKADDILICAGSGSKDHIGKVAFITMNMDYTFGGFMAVIRTKKGLLSRFLFHVLTGQTFKEHLERELNTSTINNLNSQVMSNFRIPLPPLPVQREIVRILDNFTELTAELTARKKQYEYYSEHLLAFNDTVMQMPLREIAEFRNGKGHEKDIAIDGKYVVVNSKFISTNGDIKKYSNEQICPLFVDDILMVMSDLPNGRALAKCYLVEANDRYTLNQRIGAFHVKNNSAVNVKYLYYVLNRNRQLLRFDNSVDQTNLKKDDILDIDIPLPVIEEQIQIVSILDRFDALCNDISAGLPAEIEARKKQYEYYRDQLLTFKELNA